MNYPLQCCGQGGSSDLSIPLGGNIDVPVMGRVLERGLAADGRLVKFTVDVADRPGSIAKLTRLMADVRVAVHPDLLEEGFACHVCPGCLFAADFESLGSSSVV